MKKYISTGSAVLLFLSVYSQQEHTVFSKEVHTKKQTVASVFRQKKIPFTLPANGILLEHNEGNKLFATSSRNSKLNGAWQSWYGTGALCDSGRLVNNLPDGEWKHWNEKGELQAIRHYSADKFYRVTDEMLRYNPKRSFFYLSELYQKDKQAAINYLGTAYSFPSGRSVVVQSLRQLVFSNISKSDNYRPVFEQCLLDGLYMNFFPGAVIKDSGYYKNGVRTGKWVHRDSAGGLWQQGAYHNSIKVKEWKMYDRNGKLNEIIFYDSKGYVQWRKKFNR